MNETNQVQKKSVKSMATKGTIGAVLGAGIGLSAPIAFLVLAFFYGFIIRDPNPAEVVQLVIIFPVCMPITAVIGAIIGAMIGVSIPAQEK